MNKAVRLSLSLIAVSTLAAVAGYILGRPEAPVAPPLEAPPLGDASARLLVLSLPDLEGKTQSLSQWKGKVLVANFWATWCPPCKEEMPEFSKISRKYANNGVQFVGISIDSADKVLAFNKETPVAYPLLISDLGTLELSSDLGNRAKALPFTVILRKDGSIYLVKLGKFATPELEKAIDSALRPN